MGNKVKYNLKNVYAAKLTESSENGETSYSYDTPKAIPGAVSLSLDAEGDSSPFYADGIVYFRSVANNGYSGDLEVALIPEWFRTEILQEALDSKGVLIEKSDNKENVYFALLFEFDGDANAIRHALRWCVAKPDKRKSRKITSREFSKMLYKEMEWNTRCRYKILGYKIEFEGETLYVFDLKQPEIFVEKPRKKKTVEATEQARRENEAAINADPTIPDDGRVREGKKGFFAEDIRNTFGLPVEEHNKSHEVTEIDGYTSMAILTGNTPKQGV